MPAVPNYSIMYLHGLRVKLVIIYQFIFLGCNNSTFDTYIIEC